ncbi:MAG: hypothetical protein L0I51_09205, partial [Lactococcus plantarum]|nr:hypothetical protein [Lactococcus plantarum]
EYLKKNIRYKAILNLALLLKAFTLPPIIYKIYDKLTCSVIVVKKKRTIALVFSLLTENDLQIIYFYLITITLHGA